MKFILGLVVGIAGAWLYRARGQQNLSGASEFVQHARESVTTVATAGAQRAAEVIDKAPLASQVKDVASPVVSTGQETSTEQGGSGTQQSGEAETHGVESAAGRDRTQDGDVAPDLGTRLGGS
jgi:hypothetical protein